MAQPINLPILYSFRRCPYAMRARLALYISGAKVELREIVLRDKPQTMLEISPKGTIPVLQLQDGKVIDESLDIMIWALGRQDPDEWLGADEAETQNLITRNDNEFKYALDRYKYPNRYPDEDCSHAFESGAEILKDLNARIKENACLIEDYNTLADYAIFPFIRQFKNADKDRFASLKLDALSAWLDAHLSSNLFQYIMEKYEPWQSGDAPILLGAGDP
jgi:glutathione S-transferase